MNSKLDSNLQPFSEAPVRPRSSNSSSGGFPDPPPHPPEVDGSSRAPSGERGPAAVSGGGGPRVFLQHELPPELFTKRYLLARFPLNLAHKKGCGKFIL